MQPGETFIVYRQDKEAESSSEDENNINAIDAFNIIEYHKSNEGLLSKKIDRRTTSEKLIGESSDVMIEVETESQFRFVRDHVNVSPDQKKLIFDKIPSTTNRPALKM